MTARTPFILLAVAVCALLGSPAHAECQPGQTDLGMACVGKPVVLGPGQWQLTPAAKDGSSVYRTDTITGRVELCTLDDMGGGWSWSKSTMTCRVMVAAEP